MNSLGLINYEGDCLKAINEKGSIIIKDQYGSIVDTLSPDQFYEFIDGSRDIIDSKGKSWNFPSESREAKPAPSKVYEFVNGL
jgi:hypothetical protein